MDLILIAAVTADGYIAGDSREAVTWSRDLALFKEQTMGSTLIVGSRTNKLLPRELEGRQVTVVHRDDEPRAVLESVSGERCFVIGGGRTYTRFAPFLTHLYLTVHPLIFGQGVPLFPGLKQELQLSFRKMVPVLPEEGIYQFQYTVNSDIGHKNKS